MKAPWDFDRLPTESVFEWRKRQFREIDIWWGENKDRIAAQEEVRVKANALVLFAVVIVVGLVIRLA